MLTDPELVELLFYRRLFLITDTALFLWCAELTVTGMKTHHTCSCTWYSVIISHICVSKSLTWAEHPRTNEVPESCRHWMNSVLSLLHRVWLSQAENQNVITMFRAQLDVEASWSKQLVFLNFKVCRAHFRLFQCTWTWVCPLSKLSPLLEGCLKWDTVAHTATTKLCVALFCFLSVVSHFLSLPTDSETSVLLTHCYEGFSDLRCLVNRTRRLVIFFKSSREPGWFIHPSLEAWE